MRLLKSRAYKALDRPLATTMGERFADWCRRRGETLTYAGLAHYLGGFLGFATAQALTYGDLKDAEIDELLSIYYTAATMCGVHNLAEGKMTTLEEFDQIFDAMNASTFGFSMDAGSALGTFLRQRQRKYMQTRETLGSALINDIRAAKTIWPGGPAFERPQP
ncbi:hypothetical protein [Brevundimonas sp.]|uniref:hypothetical protein n=1 Tax=Brevundimonas sp. TaxID=1871086 RepID=UPI001DBB9338|nr:hypothetical protein [Brevundimonas sp.]MBL0947596.1 hypothetical protein [Brevundimonas sp.]